MKTIIKGLMKIHVRRIAYAAAGVSLVLMPITLRGGQGQIPNVNSDDGLLYSRGQNVVPAFEGWVRNPDGTFSLVFGYFNRNFDESLYVPIGPDNHIDPGGPDRGQPTAFGPRRGKNLFEIVVPADFGKKEVVWTLVSRGKTEKAYGALVPAEVLTRRMVLAGGALSENAANGQDDVGSERDPNKPPKVTIDPVQPVSMPGAAKLSAVVSDDGLSPRSGRGQRGLRVVWSLYRGPAGVTFDPDTSALSNPTGGKATTSATFSKPGTYVLRASAIDAGQYQTNADATVVVK